MTLHKPAMIAAESVAWEPYPARQGTFRIRRYISRAGHGSELALGVCELEPGQSTVWWSFIEGDEAQEVAMRFGERAFEAYYVLEGRFTFFWEDSGDSRSSASAGPGDAFYFAPGYRYRVENSGGTTARFLFAMAPSAA